MKKRLFRTAVLMVSMAATASVQAAEFPDGAQPLKQEELQTAMAGKVFSVKVSKGPVWRWQFNTDATYVLNIGNYNDSGVWSTKDSSVCQESKRGNTGCNEIRMKENILYLQRDNEDIVTLQPQ